MHRCARQCAFSSNWMCMMGKHSRVLLCVQTITIWLAMASERASERILCYIHTSHMWRTTAHLGKSVTMHGWQHSSLLYSLVSHVLDSTSHSSQCWMLGKQRTAKVFEDFYQEICNDHSGECECVTIVDLKHWHPDGRFAAFNYSIIEIGSQLNWQMMRVCFCFVFFCLYHHDFHGKSSQIVTGHWRKTAECFKIEGVSVEKI